MPDDLPDEYEWDYPTDERCECSDCVPEYVEGPDDDEVEQEGDPTWACTTCGTMIVHMNLLTETVVCDHMALELLAASVPVKLAHPIPEVAVDTEAIDLVPA